MKKRIAAFLLSFSTLFVTMPFAGFASAGSWNTNLKDAASTANMPAKLTEGSNGISVSGTGTDALAVSKTKTSGGFILESDVTFTRGNVANMIFGAESNSTSENSFIFKLDRSNRSETKIFCFSSSRGFPTIAVNNGNSFPLNKDSYHMKVTVIDGSCAVYVDDIPVCSSVLPDYYADGYLGFGTAEHSEAIFQNTVYTDLGKKQLAKITDISVDGSILTPSYTDDVTAYGVLAVPYETESVKITVTLSEGEGNLTVNGAVAKSGIPTKVPLNVGKNIISVLLTDSESGIGIPVTVSVTRKAKGDLYRTEDYRDQYHFSPLEGWLNDPNGLIYFNNQWHLFYQYIPLTTAHSDAEKHWGHAVSDDLVHWEDLPVVLAPDKELGSIWSGSAVADPENKSGLFPGKSDKNLMAFFTHRADNNVQVQSVAYSSDGGVSWTKYKNNPILTAKDDPLNDGAFRDPNVFWCAQMDCYLMVVAGGPLRIYSSDDLLHWKFESGYDNNHPQYRPSGVGSIYSECPDLFPLAVDGDTDNVKWIYTGAGEWYMIGDLKKVDGRISFVPDSNDRHPLKFGHDAYAGVTFKSAPGGRVVMISWMANWGYMNFMPTDPWNGTFTLCYELTLKNTNRGLRIFQNPVKEYESLRGEPLIDKKDAIIPEKGENLLDGCRSDQFELVAHLKPGDSVTEVGFKLFQGSSSELIVKYNPKTARLTVDRGNVSDVKPGSYASAAISEYTVTKNADGSVDIRIFADWGSVEVIAGDGEIYASELIFPDYACIGMEAYSKGGDTAADLTVYPLGTIWRSEESAEITEVCLDVKDKAAFSIGQEVTIHSRVKNRAADQRVNWTVGNPDNAVEIVAQDETSVTLKVVANGSFSVTAKTRDGSKETTVSLLAAEKTFKTNLTDWTSSGNGSWSEVADGYQGVTGADGFSIGSERFEKGFKLELDVTMLSGTAFGIVFNSTSDPGSGSYMVNFDLTDPTYGNRFRWTEFPYRGDSSNNAQKLFADSVTPKLGKTYHIELTYQDGKLTYVFDGVTIFEGETDKDRSVSFTGGQIGVMGYNSTFVVNNVYVYTDSGLENLEFSSGNLSPEFSAEITDYTLSVPNDTDRITVTPTAGVGAEVKVNGITVESGKASAEIALAVGENTITVTVKSLESEKTYTIKVTRAAASEIGDNDPPQSDPPADTDTPPDTDDTVSKGGNMAAIVAIAVSAAAAVATAGIACFFVMKKRKDKQ